MKTLLLSAGGLLVFLMTGCSSNMIMTVKIEESRASLEGIRVERRRPASRCEKVVNPVGTFYHPIRLVDSAVTDTGGQVVFHNLRARDRFRICSNADRSVLVTVWGKERAISIQTEVVVANPWTHSLRVESKQVTDSLWPP
jgi:hypothetical protein